MQKVRNMSYLVKKGGEVIECARCHNPIKGNVMQALGYSWHKHCFRCNKCRLPIQTERFVTYQKNPYHLHCLCCYRCKESLGSRYVDYDGHPWHPECYNQIIAPLCTVCGDMLPQKHYQDYWGNRFCISHFDYAKCASCHRIVCERLTQGGMHHPDGLLICNICSQTGVSSSMEAIRIVEEMRVELNGLGLGLANASVPTRLATREDLHEHSRHQFHQERPLLGLAVWSKTSSGGRVVSRKFEHILIQKNLPEEHFRTVAIHELTHAWFFYGYYQDLPLMVEEGMCVLMEYLWLKKQATREAKFRMKTIEGSVDPVYGVGFKQAYKSKKRLPLKMLMRYLKEKKKFPSAWSAFFYY